MSSFKLSIILIKIGKYLTTIEAMRLGHLCFIEHYISIFKKQ